VIAEIELDTEDQVFDLPDWIGKEVTGNKKYYNAYLVKHPYTTWK
jgi:CYTH domain-containing protein